MSIGSYLLSFRMISAAPALIYFSFVARQYPDAFGAEVAQMVIDKESAWCPDHVLKLC